MKTGEGGRVDPSQEVSNGWRGTGLFDQAEGAVIPPRHVDGLIEQAEGEHDWQMGAAVEFNPDFAICDIDLGRHIDEVAEDLAGLTSL
jgi:hypothetical protein